MPTPSPIIAARIGAAVLTSTSDAMAVISPILVASPRSAVAIGTLIAMSEPNASSNTITAATRPNNSWLLGGW